MKKAKLRTERAKGVSSAKSDSQKPRNLAEIRQEITVLVGNGAVKMVETTMEEVSKGHYLGMKYLFEMIGLYPATAADNTPAQDSMAAVLLRRLGLPEAPMQEQGVTKESEESGAASEDVLE
jgi:hypothetical protein